MISAPVSTGVDARIIIDVVRIDQTNSGMRVMVMPGVRMLRIVTMKLIAPSSGRRADQHQAQNPQIRAGRLGEHAVRQRTVARPTGFRRAPTSMLLYMTMPPPSASQKLNAFMRGKAMSRAPIISGTK